MTLIAEIWLAHPDLVLGDVLRRDLGAGVQFDYQTMAQPDDRLLFIRVTDVDLETFERAMGADHTVSDPRLVAMFADHAVFRVEVSTDLEVVPKRVTELGARVLGVTSEGEGWRVRLHLLTRGAFDAFREYCRESGVTYKVRELSNVDTLEGGYAFGLTEQQRTTLLLAYNAGYFEVPRRHSQEDLAGELGISKSAVSQRLRRAMALLVEHTLVSGEP